MFFAISSFFVRAVKKFFPTIFQHAKSAKTKMKRRIHLLVKVSECVSFRALGTGSYPYSCLVLWYSSRLISYGWPPFSSRQAYDCFSLADHVDQLRSDGRGDGNLVRLTAPCRSLLVLNAHPVFFVCALYHNFFRMSIIIFQLDFCKNKAVPLSFLKSERNATEIVSEGVHNRIPIDFES